MRTLRRGVAVLRREAAILRRRRRLHGGRRALRERLAELAGTEAVRLELSRRLGALETSLARTERRAEVGVRMQGIHALAAWVAQATLPAEPLISVVMATRNRADCLPRAIEAVRAQTYPNWELVIADDGSEDGTSAVLEAVEDARVRSLGVTHRGTSGARNAALAEARGELVTYADDDNLMHPGWLKSVAWAFCQRPEVDVLYGALLVDDVRRVRGRDRGALPTIVLTPFDRSTLTRDNLADVAAIAHRQGLPEARFDETLATNADWDLFARLTAAKDPLALPAIACLYATDGPNRMSEDPIALVEAATVRRRVHLSLGLPAPPLPRFERVRADGRPLEASEWTLRPQAVERLLEAIEEGRETIVECGSGLSTVAIGRALRRRGRGRLFSLEHDPELARRLREQLAAEGLTHVVTVVDAPLTDDPDALDGCGWYDRDALARLPEGGIELLLVDGPPAGDGRALSRYPAMPALRDRLAPGATVILDDFDRPGERQTLVRWQREFGLEFDFDPAARIAMANLG